MDNGNCQNQRLEEVQKEPDLKEAESRMSFVEEERARNRFCLFLGKTCVEFYVPKVEKGPSDRYKQR